jgi:hypothetical protein
MPAQAHRMSSTLEFLEPRLLLAAFELGWQDSFGQPGGTGKDGAGAPADSIEAGDFYWYSDEQIPLFRANDQVVVRLANGGNAEDIMGLLGRGSRRARSQYGDLHFGHTVGLRVSVRGTH